MTQFITDEILEKVAIQRKRLLINYFVMLGIYLFICVGLLLWYWTLPFGSPVIDTVKWIMYPLTVVFIFISFVYLCIPYKRVNCFYTMCYHVRNSKHDYYEGYFLDYDPCLQNKDGVDYKSLIFIEWNKYKKVNFERRVLVPYEMEFPQIPKKAKVSYGTQANVLCEYEILSTEEKDQ